MLFVNMIMHKAVFLNKEFLEVIMHMVLTASTDVAAAEGAGAIGSLISLLLPLGILVLMYFIMIRPEQKRQKQLDAIVSAIEVGDAVVTSGGFYGVVIDIPDDKVIIVEFGNNKNCRIPMKRNHIVEVEKPGQAVDDGKSSEKEDSKDDKKGLFGKKKD